jgi:2,4-dienoyl-CoA reductase-like NADH-dependent reductase (Old Yellow Enzyme family)
MAPKLSAIDLISQPLILPCGLKLPNRLVKCPMQETLAEAPFFDPPIEKFEKLYGQWANAGYGLLITGQVQVDIRCEMTFGPIYLYIIYYCRIVNGLTKFVFT